MSGAASVRVATISSITRGSCSKPFGGDMSPAMRSAEQSSRMHCAAASAAPGLPPSRKIEAPSPAAARVSDQIRFEPATRSGSGVPRSLLAQMSGMPSATTRRAPGSFALSS